MGRVQSPQRSEPPSTDRANQRAVASSGGDRRANGAVKTVGVADDRKFLDGLLLMAAALSAAGGAYPNGVVGPGAAGEAFIEHARRGGLEVASFTQQAD